MCLTIPCLSVLVGIAVVEHHQTPCTQAFVGGQLCSTIQDAYVHQQNPVFFPNVSFAPHFRMGISDLLRTSRQAITPSRGGGRLLRRWACLVAHSGVAGE
jgi:hypothetical protein